MNTEQMAFWLSWCIEEYAAKEKLLDSVVADLFAESGVLTFLQDNADAPHTQGIDYIISTIKSFQQTSINNDNAMRLSVNS